MQDDLDSVVFDGIQFLESITRFYGPERGMEVWNKMGEAFVRICVPCRSWPVANLPLAD